jgi:uncharacterized membrane protein
MKKLLRVLAAQMFATAFVLAAVAGPARADTPPTDAELAAEWQEAWDTHKFYKNVPPAPGSGVSRASQSISIEINAPAQQVFKKYSDFNNHIGRAAFLKRVATHKEWTKAGVRYRNLTAIEDVPFEGQIVSLHTHAQQRLHLSKLFYETDTWSLPGVVTHQKIVFKKLGPQKTKVTEHLTFDAPDELIDFTVANGVASHQQTQAALKQAIESGQL